MTQLLAAEPIEKDDFILPDTGRANSRDDYFSHAGHRRLAIEMLIDSVMLIKSDPDSNESKYQHNWLLGVEDDCPISAPMCFDAVAGGGVDVGDASIQFMRAFNTDPDMLLSALNTARRKIISGEFDVGFDQMPDFLVSTSSIPRQRQAG